MIDTNANNNYGGYVFNPQNGPYQAKQSSTLTQEEYNRLIKQDNPFSLALTETEVLRGFCNHRSQDGMKDMLVSDPDGTVHCEVCGYRFSPVDPNMTKEDVQESVNLITDILQTIKLLFIDMPVPAQREFFQIIPLLCKVPQLFELAVRNFNKHENVNAWGYRGQNMGTMNLFNMLSSALNGTMPMGGMNMGQMGMPNMGQPMGQPMPGMPNPMMGAAAPGAGMGMFGTPMGGYSPETTGWQYGAPNMMGGNGQAAQGVTAGVQTPDSSVTATDGKDVQTTAKFKA